MVFSLPSVTVVSAEVSRHLRGHGLRFPYYLRLQGLMVLTFTFVFFFLIGKRHLLGYGSQRFANKVT
jgi:hypothetical protein